MPSPEVLAIAEVRSSDWRILPVRSNIRDRRVEITGPVERKMIINALNSGANVFMADFEDSNSPTWENTIEGQQNLFDAVRGTIDFTNPTNGRSYELSPDPAVLFVRPRGWHLVEKHVLLDGEPARRKRLEHGRGGHHRQIRRRDGLRQHRGRLVGLHQRAP